MAHELLNPVDSARSLGLCQRVLASPVTFALSAWLLRFRWASVLGLSLLLPLAERFLGMHVQWLFAGPVLLVMAASNAWLNWKAATTREPAPQSLRAVRHPSETRAGHSKTLGSASQLHAAGAVLAFDTLLLTLLLIASGGSGNPFTLLYIVPVVLAALALDTRWTTWLTLWTALCFASLFVPGVSPEHCHASAGTVPYAEHLRGMWVAFAFGGSVLGWIVRQLALTLSAQRNQIEQLRERALKAGHLASLTTLAAGAAHELRTPLGTIAVAAHELHRTLQNQAQPQAASDAALIEAEVERCQDILLAMGPRFNQQASHPERLSAAAVLRRVASEFAETAPDLCVSYPRSELWLLCDEEELVLALRRLVANALDATAHVGSKVQLSVEANNDGTLSFSVADTGAGMPEQVLSQATDPFFTTKEPGEGLGLGLFLVNAFCLSASGTLELQSAAGQGCRVRLSLPALPAAREPSVPARQLLESTAS